MPDENTPSSTEPIHVEMADPNGVSAAVESATGRDSAAIAAGVDTSLPKSENSNAAGETSSLNFEQMVEQRFLKLEAALMGLPAAIHKTQSEGSHDSSEAYGARVLQHLFQTL